MLNPTDKEQSAESAQDTSNNSISDDQDHKNLESPAHFSAKIKHVYLELKDYRFYHSPFSNKIKEKGKNDGRFIGRKNAITKIVNILQRSKSKSGAYLVAGYRGMGKTSMVRLAIDQYNSTALSFPWRESRRLLELLHHNLTSGWWDLSNYALPRWLFHIALSLFWVFFSLLPIYFGCSLTFNLWGRLTEQEPEIKWDWLTNCLQGNCRGDLTWEALPTFLLYFIVFLVIAIIGFLLLDTIYLLFRLALMKLGGHHDSKQYKAFEVSLAEDKISEREVLKRITNSILTYWTSAELRPIYYPYKRKIYRPFQFISSMFRIKRRRANFKEIENQLRFLEQRIVAQVSAEARMAISPGLTVGHQLPIGRLALPMGVSSSGQNIAYPVASAKEIEDELITILRRIEDFRQFDLAGIIPQFVFIIDELDKIEIPGVGGIKGKEYETEEPFSSPNYDATATRQRQQAVASLLGNLKNFLNIVSAKFFFIGGRELYDASLADIADRDSFYSSIFNQIIYVKSFFKDKETPRAGLTQMTESYLCRVLLSDFIQDSTLEDGLFSLKQLYSHLKLVENPDSAGEYELVITNSVQEKSSSKKTKIPPYEYQIMRYKVIFLLQSYIIYLTYRSNGTPKKLASLIESIIVPGDEEWVKKEKNKRNNLIVEREDAWIKRRKWYRKSYQSSDWNKRTFLRFRFDYQYEIALTAEIYRPYLIVNSRHLKALGDKLLFSSAFIFDHILKFHPFGFSWRNLELIPEVILVNREPNLRQFIEELINYLSKRYIRNTVTGIYQYRFFNKIRTELTFLSKISDLSAAAFNFTLDESLQIKKHYRIKLNLLQEKYRTYQPVEGDNRFVHSIYFVQTILGDLHFYDKEYDEALIYYTESIQSIRLPKTASAGITKHQFLLWLNNKLKCALTLEKMRAYDSALMYYTTLGQKVQQVISSRDFLSDDSAAAEKPQLELKLEQYVGGDRDMQLFSLPLLGYLAAIEKSRTDGLTYANLLETEDQILKIYGLSNLKRKLGRFKSMPNDQNSDAFRRLTLLADYYNNVGSILFYKNCVFPELLKKSPHDLPDKIRQELLSIYRSSDETQRGHFFPNISAFVYYYLAARHINDFHFDRIIREEESVEKLFDKRRPNYYVVATLAVYLLPACRDYVNANKFYYLANIAGKLADSILGMLDTPTLEDVLDFKLILNDDDNVPKVEKFIKDITEREGRFPKNTLFGIKTVLEIYQIAAGLFQKAGRENSSSFQLRKCLFVIKEVLRCAVEDKLEGRPGITEKQASELMTKLEETAKVIFRGVTTYLDVANRPQILKYREVFRLELDANEDRPIIYQNISTAPEIRETILLVEQIRVQLRHLIDVDNSSKTEGKSSNDGAESYRLDDFSVNNFFVSAYGMVSNRYTRLFELELTSARYELMIQQFYSSDIFSDFGQDVSNNNSCPAKLQETILKCELEKLKQYLPHAFHSMNSDALLIFFCKEALFCLREIVRSIHIYGLNNFVSLSYLGYTHAKLGKWCQLYRNICSYSPQCKKVLDGELDSLIGNHSIAYLEPRYHYEQAIHHFNAAAELHNEGRTYKSTVHQLFVLEDDYNDNLRHFVTALERFRLNTGSIKKIQKKLNDMRKDSKLYSYDSYYPIIGSDHKEDPKE